MTMKSDSPMAAMNANVAKALAPAVAAFSVAAPAFAEGTGEVRNCACLATAMRSTSHRGKYQI